MAIVWPDSVSKANNIIRGSEVKESELSINYSVDFVNTMILNGHSNLKQTIGNYDASI